jgi:hypothetical protein
VNRRPDFDDLLEGVESEEERARLKRVHELLAHTPPPPELSPLLETPPPASGAQLPWQRPRRLRPRAVLAVGVLITAFLVGYLAGSSENSTREANPLRDARTIQLEGEGDANGAIGIGARDEKGNWPMILSVWGLDHLIDGDYYTLALTKDGEPKVTCGTFNVSGHQTTIRMTAAYNLSGFDGWVVLRYDAQSHDDTPVLRSTGV